MIISKISLQITTDQSTLIIYIIYIYNNNCFYRFRELLANLKDDKNWELRFSILIGKITPDELSKMSGRV